MKRTLRGAVLGIALLAACWAAGSAGAQIAFYGPTGYGPAPSPLGGPRFFSVFGNPLGVAIIGVGGVQTGYVTPDGGFYPASAVPSAPVPPDLYYGRTSPEPPPAATPLGESV